MQLVTLKTKVKCPKCGERDLIELIPYEDGDPSVRETDLRIECYCRSCSHAWDAPTLKNGEED